MFYYRLIRGTLTAPVPVAATPQSLVLTPTPSCAQHAELTTCSLFTLWIMTQYGCASVDIRKQVKLSLTWLRDFWKKLKLFKKMTG